MWGIAKNAGQQLREKQSKKKKNIRDVQVQLLNR